MIIASADRIAEYTAKGWWKSALLGDWLTRNAEQFPEREALVDPPNRQQITGGEARRITWRQTADAVERLASYLLAVGLRKDDVVVIQLANTWELLAVYFACARIGVVASPLPAQYRENELTNILRTTNARAIICATRINKHDHAQMALQLARQHPSVQYVLAVGERPPLGALDLSEAIEHAPDTQAIAKYVAANPVSANDATTIVWTSGTESNPKGVARSHNDWLIMAPFFAEQFGIEQGCRLLAGRQLVTCGSFTAYLVPWLVRAGTIILHHPFQLPLFLQQLREERINFTSLAPAILASLYANSELLAGIDFSRLKYMSSGSAPLPEVIVSGLESKFGVKIVNVLGSTEGAALISSPVDIPDPGQRAQYFPRMGVSSFHWQHPVAEYIETRLVDPNNETVITEPGRVGEIRYRGPLIFGGYFNAPELTKAAFDSEGFYRSGDLFEIAGDQNQYYRYFGRCKEIIIRGGMNISAAELEDMLTAYPKIREAAAVGYPDSRLGERVCIFVVPKYSVEVTLEEIIAYLRDEKRVAVHKLPEKLVVIPSLPRSPLGKVMKVALRKQVAAEETVGGKTSIGH